jgi:hypothetical protein
MKNQTLGTHDMAPISVVTPSMQLGDYIVCIKN